MGRKQNQFFYWTKPGYFFRDKRNVFTLHQKGMVWSNLNKNKSQIYSYCKNIFRRKKCDIISLFSHSYYSTIETRSCVITLVKWRDFPGENKENLTLSYGGHYLIEISPLILRSESMDWFLYDNDLRLERVKWKYEEYLKYFDIRI